jgi:DNA repair exonuclease SbcCD ATPase subunit
MPHVTETAEERFRAAFERLKINAPIVLPNGTPVSQNNVAKEANTDPTALRKSRYPTLIRDIQSWVGKAALEQTKAKMRQVRQNKNKESMIERIETLTRQRDQAQSEALSLHRLVLELSVEKAKLQSQLEKLLPPPTPLTR